MSKPSRKEDLIAQIVLDHFSGLGKSPLSSSSSPGSVSLEYTVVAAFVVEAPQGRFACKDQSNDNNFFYPLSIASGTKCLGAREVAEAIPGTVLKDSHAEVLARRAFNRFLLNFIKQRGVSSIKSKRDTEDDPFDDLLLPIDDAEDSIIEKSVASHDRVRYRWNPEWKLHLYISDSPCGDASIYEKESNRKRHGRRHLSSNEFLGTDFDPDINFTGAKLIGMVEEGQEQRVGCMRLKSGRSDIPDGYRTTSYSCSDKIAKWTVVGVQSAIVSTLITPIYLNSIIVSLDPMAKKDSQAKALRRAIISRTEEIKCSVELDVSKACELLISSCTYNYSKSMIDHISNEESYENMQFKKQQRNNHSEGSICHKRDDEDNGLITIEEKTRGKIMKSRPAGCSLNWIRNEHGEHKDSRIELTQAQNGLKMGITTKTMNKMKTIMQKSSLLSNDSLPDNLNRVVSRLSQVSMFSLYKEVLKFLQRGEGKEACENSSTTMIDSDKTTLNGYFSKKESAVIHNKFKNVFLASENFKQWRLNSCC